MQRSALENLSYRERRVLELRYGLDGEDPRTLDEVGRTFNVTRERIRQVVGGGRACPVRDRSSGEGIPPSMNSSRSSSGEIQWPVSSKRARSTAGPASPIACSVKNAADKVSDTLSGKNKRKK